MAKSDLRGIDNIKALLNSDIDVKPFDLSLSQNQYSYSKEQVDLLVICPNRTAKKREGENILVKLDNTLLNMLSQKTAGSKTAVINKLLYFALEELEKQNIILK